VDAGLREITVLDERCSEDDGLALPVVGEWTLRKHQKMAYYSSLFSTSMKRRWDCRVYLELFAGAGKARIEETEEVIPGSPLLALGLDDPFDKYVFCERDSENMAALKHRVAAYFPERDVRFVHGDANSCVDEILRAIPQFTKTNKGLTLCFVDPYKMSEIAFETIAAIAAGLYVDFLMLIPTYMDIHRNPKYYTQDASDAVDRYLGSKDWRSRWNDPTKHKNDFGLFIANEFGCRMAELGFLYEGLEDLELVRMAGGRNLPLYHLAFFSKSDLGLRFWRETRERTNPPSLF